MKRLILACTSIILSFNFLLFQTIVRYIEPKVLFEQNVVYAITMITVLICAVACLDCYNKIK